MKLKIAMATFLDKIKKSKTHDCECSLSPMILKGNQMVHYCMKGMQMNFVLAIAQPKNPQYFKPNLHELSPKISKQSFEGCMKS